MRAVRVIAGLPAGPQVRIAVTRIGTNRAFVELPPLTVACAIVSQIDEVFHCAAVRASPYFDRVGRRGRGRRKVRPLDSGWVVNGEKPIRLRPVPPFPPAAFSQPIPP